MPQVSLGFDDHGQVVDRQYENHVERPEQAGADC